MSFGVIYLRSNTQMPNPEIRWPQPSPTPHEPDTFAHRSHFSSKAVTVPSDTQQQQVPGTGIRCQDFARFCFCCAKMLNWSFLRAQQRQPIAALGPARGGGGGVGEAQPVGISLIQTEEKTGRDIRLCSQLPFHHC